MPPTPSFASLKYGLPYSIWQAIITVYRAFLQIYKIALVTLLFLPHDFYLIIIIIYYAIFTAFNINHSSILPLMALNSLYCADVPLRHYSLTPYSHYSPWLFSQPVCSTVRLMLSQIRRSLRLSVTIVSHGKTAEPIRMLFGTDLGGPKEHCIRRGSGFPT